MMHAGKSNNVLVLFCFVFFLSTELNLGELMLKLMLKDVWPEQLFIISYNKN